MFKGRVTTREALTIGLVLCLFPVRYNLPFGILGFEEEPNPPPEETPRIYPSSPPEVIVESSADIKSSESEIQILTEDTLFNQDAADFSQTFEDEMAPSPFGESHDLQQITANEYSADETSDLALGSFVIKIPLGTTLKDYSRSIEGAGLIISSVIPELGVIVVDGIPENPDALEGILSNGYQYFEEDLAALYILDLPNDPYFSLQYGLNLIHAPEGWKYEKGSSLVTIAVLDTGVDLSHPELVDKLTAGYNFVSNNDIPQDDNGHGTGVAGICAAVTDNAAGIAGVSWGASIMPLKILDASGNGSFANAAKGIIWAANHGAQVINLSLGGYNSSSLLEDAINYALQKGVIVVAAVGNDGINSITYPARYPGVIAVGSVGQDGYRSVFSNYGPELDVVAPGSAIFSLSGLGNFGYLSGTSAAAPFTSGLTALLLSVKGNSYQKIGNQICRSSLDLGARGFDELYGCGLIQVDRALKLALGIGDPKKTNHHSQNNFSNIFKQPTEKSQPDPVICSDLENNEQDLFMAARQKEQAAETADEFFTGKGSVFSNNALKPVIAKTEEGLNPIAALLLAAFAGIGIFIKYKNRRKTNEQHQAKISNF